MYLAKFSVVGLFLAIFLTSFLFGGARHVQAEVNTFKDDYVPTDCSMFKGEDEALWMICNIARNLQTPLDRTVAYVFVSGILMISEVCERELAVERQRLEDAAEEFVNSENMQALKQLMDYTYRTEFYADPDAYCNKSVMNDKKIFK